MVGRICSNHVFLAHNLQYAKPLHIMLTCPLSIAYIESIMKRRTLHEELWTPFHCIPCIVVLFWSFLSFQFNSSNVLHDNILNSISHYNVLRTETETFGKIYKEKTRRFGVRSLFCSHIGRSIQSFKIQDSRK